jgi:hypothetical protein
MRDQSGAAALICRELGKHDRDTLMQLPFLGLVAMVLVAGCASGSGLPPDTERAIETYYADHASEEHDRCVAPYIDGFTRVEIVEDSPERQVVDARYLYGDRIKDRQQDGGRQCVGYNGRRFTLAKSDAGVEVIEMTGPQRG